jgi:O-antigen/teichoic acid export membrane protein
MARLTEAGEDPRSIIERSVGVVAVASGVFLTTLAASGPSLLPAVVGSRWREAADILPAACLGLMVVGPISVSVAGYLFAQGDAKTPLRGAIFHTAAQFAVALPLLPAIGGWAIGLGGLAAGLVEATVLGREAARRSGARLLGPLSVPLVAATLAGFLGWLLAVYGHPTFPRAVLAGGTALILYLTAVAVVRPDLLKDSVRLARRGLRRSSPAT